MSDPFLAQVTMFAGNFNPRGWAYCSGQLLPISQNSALFSLLGTTYGGDGRVTFALPDLRGRTPRGAHGSAGPGLPAVQLGNRGGAVSHTMTVAQMPAHTHAPHAASEDAVSSDPGGKFCATTEGNIYQGTGDETMGATTSAGSNQSFSLLNPYLGLNFIIATQGTFPSRN